MALVNRAVGFLHNASACAAGAHMLRLMDAQSVLLPISSLPGDDEHHTPNSALMCLICVMGNLEARAQGQASPIMLMRPDALSVGDAARPPQRCARG
jgi:hypothetical protein